ncbi:Zn-ribbon domain-containing OB-fold protein [Spirillospora sp. CA-255316]
MANADEADLTAYQPRSSAVTAAFWDGASQGELMIARCPACREWQHPPLEKCRHCATLLRAEPAVLEGFIYSSTVMHHGSVPLYPTPYVVAVVAVGQPDGPRVVMRVVDSDADVARPDAPVRIEFRELPGGDHHVPVAVVASPARRS